MIPCVWYDTFIQMNSRRAKTRKNSPIYKLIFMVPFKKKLFLKILCLQTPENTEIM